MSRRILSAAIVLLVAGVCVAQRRAVIRMDGNQPAAATPADAKLHIKQGSPASFPWVLTGRDGVRWQVATNGSMTSAALKNAVHLEVGGASFPGPGNAVLNAAGNEIELAPGQFNNNTVRIYRRVMIDAEHSVGRWIDIIEATGQPASLNLRYWVYLPSANPALAKGENAASGYMILPTDPSTKAAAAFVFAAPEGEGLRPVIETPSADALTARVSVDVQPGKPVALCFFIVQRKSPEDLPQAMQQFDPYCELADVSPELRRIILNVPAQASAMGAEFERDYEADVVRLSSGDQLRGQITNADFEIKTDFGPMRVPSANVIGLIGLSSEQDAVKLGTTDGQVLLGELSVPLAMKLAGGSELTVPARKLRQAAYQVTQAKPRAAKGDLPIVVLQRGEWLAFDPAGVKLDFLTSCGKLTLDASQVALLEMSVPQGVHRLTLRNGSVLSGLATQDAYKFKLALASEASVPAWQVRQIRFAATPKDDDALARVTLENHDVLQGQFAEPTWTIRSQVGDVEIKPQEIAKADFSEGVDAVQVELKNGTHLGGKLVQEYVTLRLVPTDGGKNAATSAPELKILSAKIAKITGGNEPTTQKASAGIAGAE